MADVQQLVEVELHERWAVLTLNRPDKMNAVNIELADQLVAALQDLDEMSAIVLTGSGRAFCAGIDLKELPAHRMSWRSSFGTRRSQYWADTIDAMRRHPAVFIAAVNGFALGGGLTLVNNSELAIASAAAEFGIPEVGFGSFPALSGPSTVRRLLPKHVSEMVFLAKRIDAAKAQAWGLVNEVVAPSDLLPRAREVAEAVAGHDPVTVAHTKRAIRAIEEMGWVEATEYGALVSASIKATRAAHDIHGSD